jgi:type I restriction enzyme S subunit
MSEWREITVEDIAAPGRHSLATGPFGSAISARFFTESGVPVIRGSNLSLDVGRRLIDEDLVFIPEELAERFDRSSARVGDLVFTCWGTIGQVGLIDDQSFYDRYIVSNKQMKLTPNRGVADPLFLYYAFSEASFVEHLQGISIGSSVPGFNLGQLRKLILRIPSLADQQSIIAVLGALDDKIAANNRIVRASDELRALRLQYWTRSNPDSIKASAPSSLATFVNGRAFTKDATGSGRMVIRIAEINSGPGGSTVYNDLDVPDEHLARPGDVLFAWSGSLAVTRWFRPEAIVNQHIFKVIPNVGVPAWLAYELVRGKLADFKAIAAGKATTMGHIQRHHLDEPILAPKPDHIDALDAELGPLWERALTAEQESLTLADLRDTLLPRLMSGAIRMRDAERIAEDAT